MFFNIYCTFLKFKDVHGAKKNLTNEVYTSELDFRFLKGIYVRNFSFMNYMSSAISIQKYYYSVFFFFHQNNIKIYIVLSSLCFLEILFLSSECIFVLQEVLLFRTPFFSSFSVIQYYSYIRGP